MVLLESSASIAFQRARYFEGYFREVGSNIKNEVHGPRLHENFVTPQKGSPKGCLEGSAGEPIVTGVCPKSNDVWGEGGTGEGF